MRKLSTYLVLIGSFSCLIGAIWSPEEGIKWILSALYLLAVGKWFGLSYRKEKVLGEKLHRPKDTLKFPLRWKA